MLDDLLARCAPAEWLPGLAAAAGAFGLPGTLFAVGLLGGVVHCAGMCGPFVLAQTAHGPAIARVSERLLLPYQAGRLTTYTLLGAVAGATSGAFGQATGLRTFAVALLVLGAVVFAAQAAAGFGWRTSSAVALPSSWSAAWGKTLGRVSAPLMAAPRGPRGIALGLVLGFLPCGLLWGALAVAAGTGRAASGALAMAAFALGTVPALAGIAWAGSAATIRFKTFARVLAPPLLLANAAFLLYFAWRAGGG